MSCWHDIYRIRGQVEKLQATFRAEMALAICDRAPTVTTADAMAETLRFINEILSQHQSDV